MDLPGQCCWQTDKCWGVCDTSAGEMESDENERAYLSEGLAAVMDWDGPADEDGEERADSEEGGKASSESWWSTAAVRLAISVWSWVQSLVVVTVNPNPPSAALRAPDRAGRAEQRTSARETKGEAAEGQCRDRETGSSDGIEPWRGQGWMRRQGMAEVEVVRWTRVGCSSL